MPSGSTTLLEAVKWGSDPLKKGVVEIIIQESPVLMRLPMIKIHGNALRRKLETTLPTVSFRDVNETYTRDFGTDEDFYWGCAILGGEVFVDNFIINTMGDLGDVKARQFAKKAKAAALTFEKYFYDGTGASKDFKGVNTLLGEGFGSTVGAAGNATNGGTLTLDDLDIAYDLLRTGSADLMTLNRTVRRKITKLARTSVTGVSLIDVGDDAFGRQVVSWNGVPMGIVGDDATGTQILAFDETQGSTNTCASVYFFRFDEDEGVAGLFGANGYFEVKDFGEQQSAPGHMGRLEFYPGITVASQYSFQYGVLEVML